MKTLQLNATQVTPAVDFNPKTRNLEIVGYSRPENVRDFFFPLVQWIDEYKNFIMTSKTVGVDIEPITFKFKFEYFNSSSAKFIYDIIILLNEFKKEGIPLKIYWFYDEDDDEVREAGEELSDMANVPFIYVETKR